MSTLFNGYQTGEVGQIPLTSNYYDVVFRNPHVAVKVVKMWSDAAWSFRTSVNGAVTAVAAGAVVIFVPSTTGDNTYFVAGTGRLHIEAEQRSNERITGDLTVDGTTFLQDFVFDESVGRLLALGAGKSAAAASKEALLLGSTTYEGMSVRVLDQVVACSAVENAMTQAVPKGAVILAVNANADTALTAGGTTATWSVGITGDVDKYGTAGAPTQSDSLAKNSKSSSMFAPTPLAAAETLKVCAAATGGASAGDTGITGSVRVQVVYLKPISLDDAA